MNPHHYAVVVGIGRYPGGFPQLSGPVHDATAFADWLKSRRQGGVPAKNIELVLTPRVRAMALERARPTKEMIDKALQAVYDRARRALKEVDEEEREAVRAQTRLYIFVAGHGIMPGGGQSALLDATAMPDRQLNLELRSYLDFFETDGTFGEVCVFSDCCRTYAPFAQPGGPPFDKPARFGGEVSTLFGWATTAGRMSFGDEESPDDARGYFSRALVAGLRGNATDPDVGVVTASSLRAYVAASVRESTRNKPEPMQQIVTMPVDPDRQIAFGPVRKDPRQRGAGTVRSTGRDRRKIEIHFPDGFADAVELVAPDGSKLFYWDPADGVWTVRLFDGSWIVQRAGSDMDTTGLAGDGVFTVLGEDRVVQL
jgi:hypothetical protein